MEIINKVVFEKSEIEKIKILIKNAIYKAKAINDAVYWEDVENKTYEVNKCLNEIWNMLGG